MLLGLTIPPPAIAKPPSGDGNEEARAVLGEQRVRGDARRRGRGDDLDKRLRPRGRDRDDVEAAGLKRGERQRDARREVLDVDVLELRRDVIGELAPARRRRRTRARSRLRSASSNARSSVHSWLRRPSARRTATSSCWPKRTRVTRARRSSSAITSASAGSSAPATSTASACEHRRTRRRGERLAAARDGRGPERRVHLLDAKPCSRATASSASTASAISSGAVPAPVKQAIVAVSLMPAPPRRPRRWEPLRRSRRAALNRLNAALSSSPETTMPCSAQAIANAWRPECLPSGSVIRTPTSAGSMIWYVRSSFSIPSWWMPASCANAFAPTTALFGWTIQPVRSATRRDAAASRDVSTPVSTA